MTTYLSHLLVSATDFFCRVIYEGDKLVLFSNAAIDDITKSVRWADSMVRSDLAIGLIANENDYTSNLTNTIRQQINSKKRLNDTYVLRATSLVLKPSVERKVGCDAGIILSNTKEFKVCLFEAKLPRLITSHDSWDSIQKATKYTTTRLSHFSEQIKKQESVSHDFGVWEMFYCEYDFGDQPNYMNYNTSSCIWHEDAQIRLQKRDNTKTWSDIELEELLSSVAYPKQIDNMVKEVCLCNKGKVFTGDDYLRVFSDYGFPKKLLLIECSQPQSYRD